MKPCHLLLILVLAISLFSGCKKDKQNASKLYLVKQVVTEFKDYLDKKDTVQYQYDNQNRLTGYGLFYKGKYERLYTFFYDSSNRIVQVNDYNTAVDTLLYSVFYNYTGSGFTENWSYANGQNASSTFTLNSGHQVARMDQATFYTLFDYDAKGNLIHVKSYSKPGQPPVNEEYSLAYDTYKNPFYAQKGNYAFMFLVIPHINTCVNNLEGNMDYQYNSDGYPVTVLTHDQTNGRIYTYYDYTVK
jgi:hypothetical protein